MRLFSLSPRLAACAGLARPGVRLADIGTDHAKLPVWLSRQGIIKSALACDISTRALDSAEKTIAIHGAGDLVRTRLSDGLTAIRPDEIDDIVIAGMGGEQIGRIVDAGAACHWLKNPRYNLILQPMSHPERLRADLSHNRFGIIREIAVRENNRIYLVIQARYCGLQRPVDPYIGKLTDNHDEASRDYLRRQARLLRLEARGYGAFYARNLENTADRMDEAAKGMETTENDHSDGYI